jgi:2-keto-3-deoxy-L-rhamnonate aldolase RhmA
MVRHPGISRIAAHAGLDFIMLDLEHGSYSFDTVVDMFATARAAGIGTFARVPELTKGYVSRMMDCGANGIMVPMLESADQAKRFVAWAKFAPLGDRGLGSSGAHTDYGGMGGTAPEFMQRANEETLTIAQIETARAVEDIDAIASVEGIDALLIGPNDLSISLGCAGDLMNPKVQEAIGKVADAASKWGKIFGMHAGDALLDKWIPKGLTLVMSSLDISVLASGFNRISQKYSI